MKYELWYSPSEMAGVLLHEADRGSTQLKPPDARVIWSVDAVDYDEACRKRDEYFQSEQSQFVTFSDRATTRFTFAEYLDGDGRKHSLTAPGWVGMARPLMDEGVDVSVIVGQLFIERPGADAPFDFAEFARQSVALGFKELTVVDLRSINGGERRMSQEFHGRIEGPERIWNVTWRRLGEELSNWRIVESIVFRCPDAGDLARTQED